MSSFAAVLDANVLYGFPLANVLLELAEARLWTKRCPTRASAVTNDSCPRWNCRIRTTVSAYIALLERQSLPESAAALRELLGAE